jgi:hypothetical protein
VVPVVKNSQVSDVPSNWDYTFRAGLFGGDYTMNATGSINPNLDKHGDDPNADRAYGRSRSAALQ